MPRGKIPLQGMLYQFPNIIAQLILILFTRVGISEKVDVTSMGPLPDGLSECSGVVALQPNLLVMINDSRNDPVIWVCDTLGNLKQKIRLKTIENGDWESLASNDSLLFIGDIGNNGNKRRDLRIHFFRWEVVGGRVKMSNGGRLDFRYRDQVRYPPIANRLHFDAEALIAVGDSLYIFTKSRAIPFQGITYCYGLPARPGVAEAVRLDSVVTGPGVRVSHWITGADYNAETRRLALISYDRLWIFKEVRPPHFFTHPVEPKALGFLSQMEGVAWRNARSLWLTNERNSKRSGRLYNAHLGP